MTKTELRQSLREKRGSLTKEYMMQANQGILSRFLMYPVSQQIDSIFAYVRTEDKIYNPRMQSEDLAGELHRESAGKRFFWGLQELLRKH